MRVPNRVAGDTVSSTWDGWHDQGTEVKGNMDVRYDVPLYTLTDIGRFLDLAPSTLHYWVHEKGIVRHLPRTGRGEPYLPFAAVAEAQFTQSLRRAGLQLQAVVEGVTQLRKELGHNWLSADLSHDGVDVLRRYADAGHPTWARVRDGQGGISSVVEVGLQPIRFDPKGLPERVVLNQFTGASVIIDPRFSFGQPIVEDQGVRLEDIAGMFFAGESVEVVAEEYGVEPRVVEAVIRNYGKRVA